MASGGRPPTAAALARAEPEAPAVIQPSLELALPDQVVQMRQTLAERELELVDVERAIE